MVLPLPLMAVSRPGLLRQGLILPVRQGDGLHHLAQHTVGQNHGWHPVFVPQVESVGHQVHHFLHGGGGQNQHMIIAVAAALGGLPIVGLCRLDAAQARAAPLHIDNQGGQVAAGNVRDPLGLQADAGRGGGGHGTDSRSGSPQHHVDGGHFGFRLEIGAPYFGHPFGHIRRQFRLGRDGVTEEMAAARLDSGLGQGFVALHQYLFRHFSHSFLTGFLKQAPEGFPTGPLGILCYRSTVMAISGHIMAQAQHPTQASGSIRRAG